MMEIETKIQKWGNGLALRVSGVMRDLPQFQEGTKVVVKVTEKGLNIKKAKPQNKKSLPFSEKELIEGLSENQYELPSTFLDSELGDE